MHELESLIALAKGKDPYLQVPCQDFDCHLQRALRGEVRVGVHWRLLLLQVLLLCLLRLLRGYRLLRRLGVRVAVAGGCACPVAGAPTRHRGVLGTPSLCLPLPRLQKKTAIASAKYI